MTTFITGGTSSIGRVLVKELARQGEDMRVLVRPNSDRSGLELPEVTFVPGDVTAAGSVRQGMAGCQRVSHLAAVVGQNVPEETWWRVNRDGTRNVLQAAVELGVESMVQISSVSVLGPTAAGELSDKSPSVDKNPSVNKNPPVDKNPSVDETRPIDTTHYMNLYQKTKHAADEIAREYAGRGLRVSIVYPSFGFGCSRAFSHPSMQDQTLLRMAAGKPVAIFGNGKNLLTLSYYKDTARGILLAHQHGQPGSAYILGGEVLTFTQIWAAIARLLGKQPPTRRVPLPVLQLVARASRLLTGKSLFPPEFFEMIALNWNFSSAKAVRELGWNFTPFEAAIAETWQEYQAMGWKPVYKPG